jgi:hypothetical protein
MTLLQRLIEQITEKSQFQAGQEISPLCILWTDKGREWEAFLPILDAAGLDIFILGDYSPEKKSGPAPYILWSLTHAGIHSIPLVYLPGFGVEELKATDSCSPSIQPLAALRYQSTVFSHPNGKDWSLSGWFSSATGAALNLQDSDQARTMLRSSFRYLLQKPLEELRDTIWTTENLTGTVVCDPVLSALKWLGGGKTAVPTEDWAAFTEKAKKEFGFIPEKQSTVEVAARLASGTEKKLDPLWARFSENPSRYPLVISLLGSLVVPTYSGDLLIPPDFGRYPQWYKKLHETLASELRALGTIIDQFQLISRLNKLWGDFHELESSLWAAQAPIPLLPLLKDLSALAVAVQKKPTNHDWPALVAWYSSSGMEADRLVLKLMGWKQDLGLRTSLQAILQNLYLPWLEALTRIVEQAYMAQPEYFTQPPLGSSLPYITHEAVLFVDALRMDLGSSLGQMLKDKGLSVEITPGVTVLPTTTSTAKAAVSPLRSHLQGGDLNTDDAYPILDGKACNADVLRKGLEERGWSILKPDNLTLVQYGWMENNDLDSRGHEGTLQDQVTSTLDSLVYTIQKLLERGWERVRVVTDHGFLLVPLGLPKTNLPPVLVESKGGRAAIMKLSSQAPNLPVPWFWDPVQNYNLAPGISTFYQSNFAHGGLSLQELVVPTLLVTANSSGSAARNSPVDATLIWKGLRLRIGMDEHPENWSMDLRHSAVDPATSLLGGKRPLASSIAVDDDHQGKKAQFMILDEHDAIVFQRETVIGE